MSPPNYKLQVQREILPQRNQVGSERGHLTPSPGFWAYVHLYIYMWVSFQTHTYTHTLMSTRLSLHTCIHSQTHCCLSVLAPWVSHQLDEAGHAFSAARLSVLLASGMVWFFIESESMLFITRKFMAVIFSLWNCGIDLSSR